MNIKKLSPTEYEYFRKKCNFNDEELMIYDLRAKNKTVTEIQFKLYMSESTIYRRLRSIKRKIKDVENNQ